MLLLNDSTYYLTSSTLKLRSEYIQTGDIANPKTASSETLQRFALGFLREYMIRMEELDPYSTIISNKCKNDNASGTENLAFFKVLD
ncbi:MAG: hypothetical protein S4CHLAM20_06920 [Chlamydiia bacterium]|nr:hypothetical protein [Chlamydiia bacterium]